MHLGINHERTYRVYGAVGSGSVAVEAALTLLKQPYEVVEAVTWLGEEQRAIVRPVNPMEQIPVLVTPQGEVTTESAAILIWLGDLHPEAGLAPGVRDPERAQYLRWMSFIPASIYSMFWVRDVPDRLAPSKDAQDALLERTVERIKFCWKTMDAAVEPGPWILGPRMSLLDLYVTVVSRWTPRRRWLHEACPNLAEVVTRIDALPELQAFWAERFPFSEGWEG